MGLQPGRDRLALELRLSGMSYREVAATVGLPGPSAAYRACRRSLRHIHLPPPDVVAAAERERLAFLAREVTGTSEEIDLRY